MKAKQKKRISNIIMVALIVVIAFCGIMAVGSLKGWFGGSDKAEHENATVATQETNANIGMLEDDEELNEYSQDSDVDEDSDVDVAEENSVNKCTISINCKTILSNMDNLTPGKSKYVPSNGVILTTTTVEFKSGDTVFDVLKRVCSAAGIQLEYSDSTRYGGKYIEGINHLYEFDCGQTSGWMYKVNGSYPNYGCSGYKLKNGDSIVWTYTCSGN